MNGCIGISKSRTLTTGHTLYSDLLQKVHLIGKVFLDPNWAPFSKMQNKLLYGDCGGQLVECCSTGTFALKSSLLEHFIKDFDRLGLLSVLDASPLEHFLTTNILYCRASRW